MAVSSRFRLGLLALIVAVAIALGLLLLPDSDRGASADPAPTGGRMPGRQILLRPQDLGRDYHFLDFNEGQPVPKLTCGRLQPATPTRALADWLDSDKPAGCMTLYDHARYKRFRVVGTGALDAGSEEAAKEGLALTLDLLASLGAGEDPVEIQPQAKIGDETRVFIWTSDGFFTGAAGGVLTAWRSGDVLAAVYFEGKAAKGNQRAAFALAKRQQRKRIEHPSPFNPGRTSEP